MAYKPTREEFVHYYSTLNLSVNELCEKYGVTRKVIFKWAREYSLRKTPEQRKALIQRYASKRDYVVSLEKRRKTCKERYGVDSVSKVDAIKKRKEETTFKHYGVKHSVKIPHVVEANKKACRDKYGVDTVFARRDIIHDLIQHKYHTDNVSTLPEIKEKKRQASLAKFGTEVTLKAPEVLEKSKQTCLRKYGVEYAAQSPELQKKALRGRYKKGMGRSALEKEIEQFIATLGVSYKTNVYTHSINELDILIPDYNLAIECNGDYWHSTKNKAKDFHINKTQFCNKQGIQLIHVFECEWNNKQDIVKSIISARLGKYAVKYRADKANVTQEPYSFEIRDFLNRNHIQGEYAHAQYCYCLRDKKTNQLMSCMLFSKDTRNKKYPIVLSRFCSLLGYNIPYAATRLFTAFRKDHPEITQIVSYSDNRWFSGKLYERLGFTLSHSTKQDYFYIVSGQIKNKSYGMKSNLKKMYPNLDITKTESELTESLRWHKVYDCGKKVWMYNQAK